VRWGLGGCFTIKCCSSAQRYRIFVWGLSAVGGAWVHLCLCICARACWAFRHTVGKPRQTPRTIRKSHGAVAATSDVHICHNMHKVAAVAAGMLLLVSWKMLKKVGSDAFLHRLSATQYTFGCP
jgi:hypothetical protein